MGRLLTSLATVTAAGIMLSVFAWWALVGGVADLYSGIGNVLFP